MKSKTFTVILVAIFTLFASGASFSEQPSGVSGDRGGGGGNQDKGDLYADPLVIDRDVNGVPLLSGTHVQPILWSDEDLWPEECLPPTELLPVGDGSIYYNGGFGNELALHIPLNEEGEIQDGFVECALDPHIGRLSVARAPVEVREMALEEAENILGGGTIDLDPAGRLRVDLGTEGYRTIDASLENLAMYEALMEDGELPTVPIASLYPTYLHAAAAMLGGAADKTGDITLVDVTEYVNAYMSVPDETSKDVNLPHVLLPSGQKFYDFNDFYYERSLTFDRELCYLKVVMDGEEPAQSDESFLVDVITKEVMEIEGLFEGAYSGRNIEAFAQAADDTRRVIEFMHTHTVPEELLGACGDTGDPE